MTPSYTKTKKITKWLEEVRPDYEIANDKFIEEDGNVWHILELQLSGVSETMVDLIDLDTLHAILWELFDVENPEYHEIIHSEATLYAIVKRMARLYAPKTLADALWHRYTAGKESMWITNPDSVLDDIILNYNDLTK